MRLTQFWMSSMQAARTALDDAGQTAAELSSRLREMLELACEGATRQGYARVDAEQALFAVVAWIDEMAMTHAWPGAADWRLAPLQRQFFSTTRAGTVFFEKLELLGEGDSEVREVYALILLAGFQGHYAHRPPEELEAFREALLMRVALERRMAPLSAEQALFPGSGWQTAAPKRRSRTGSPTMATVILIVAPLICLLGLYLILDTWVAHVAAGVLAPLAGSL